MAIDYGTNDAVTSGNFVASSGNFFSALTVNNIPVSILGHTHTSADITDLGSLSSFSKISFDTTLEDPDLTTGELAWNSSEGSLGLGISDTHSIFMGEEMLYRVRNNSGNTILAGTPVYASGLTPGANNRIAVSPYVADGSVREIRFMGLMMENCATGVDGYATHLGYIKGIDTRGNATNNGTTNKLWSTDEPEWFEGDILYVHPTASGKLTKIEPQHSISVAMILNKNEQQGKLFVRPTSYGHLGDNHDVSVSGVKDYQYLAYYSGTWLPTNKGIFDTIYTSGNIGNATGEASIYLNAPSGNRIDFNAFGIGAPSFTSNRSQGTKIVLAPNVSSTQTEFAIGMEAGAMWFSIPVASSRAFKWYAGTANIATLLGNGTLNITGATSQINVDDIRLDNNMLSIVTSNTDLILRPNGNGAFLADSSGNIRGTYSTDLQRERVSASGVAAGNYSVICGGSDNRAAGSYAVVGGGQTNTASNNFTTISGGDLNTSTGIRATICGGGSNTASALSSVVSGGSNNQAGGVYSIVPGGFRGKATRHGEFSHAAGLFNSAGDAQHTILIGRRLTTDDSEQILTLNGLAPSGTTNIFNIPAQTCWAFDIKVSAYNVTNNQGGWWIFKGGIRRNHNNATTLIGDLVANSGVESSIATSAVTVVADDTNEALEIKVSGVASKNIRWVGVVDFSQVSYGVP